MTTAQKSASGRRVLATALVVLVSFALIALGYLLYIARQIARESTVNEEGNADVIIVLGAAEYHGLPSPVLKARLNHALVLYLQHRAPYILTTGGAGGDPVFTEGEVGRSYLTRRGVPSEAILVEPEGTSTAESLGAAVQIMNRMRMHSCIVVSDGYHIFRVKRMLQFQGIKVYGSPRPTGTGKSGSGLRLLYLKQAIGFTLWRIGINV